MKAIIVVALSMPLLLGSCGVIWPDKRVYAGDPGSTYDQVKNPPKVTGVNLYDPTAPLTGDQRPFNEGTEENPSRPPR